jgi:holo-[acyl-carrier protein] synthase
MLFHGVDLVAIPKFGKMIHRKRFLDRCFTPSEQSHCGDSAERYAARFAAKEAVLKALGLGIVDGVSLKDVEVIFRTGGTPGISLIGEPAAVAKELGIVTWAISFAHSGDYAVASVVGLGTLGPTSVPA